MKTHEELLKQQEHLLKVYEKVKDKLSKYPNVVNIVIGLKEVDGKLTDEGCIKIIVSNKKSITELDPDDIIPKKIEGVKTDVIIHEEEILQAVCAGDRVNHRPIKGGIMINNYRNGSGAGGSGTLGCLAQLDSDNSWVILSNHHVLYGTNGQDGDEIGQPAVGCSWCCKTNVIAVNFNKDETLDCAIAKVKDDIAIDNVILEVGSIQANGAVAAIMGQRVRKKGATTGFTSGTISAVDPANGKVTVSPNVAGGPANDPGGCTNYEAGVTVFTNPGDSGSVYVNDNNEVVALHYAGLNTSNASRGNDIIRIQTALNITIKTTSAEPGVTPEFRPSTDLDSDNNRLVMSNQWIELIDKKLEGTSTGKIIQSIIKTHQEEVFDLINKRRPVTVVWQRKQGPAFIAALGRSFKYPEYSIPSEINRVSPQNLLMSMSTIMEEHGSESLRKDISKYTLPIIQFVKEHDTVEAMLQQLTEIDKESKILTHQE